MNVGEFPFGIQHFLDVDKALKKTNIKYCNIAFYTKNAIFAFTKVIDLQARSNAISII